MRQQSNHHWFNGRHQAIIRTNSAVLLTVPLGTNFSEIVIEILTFSYTIMHLNMPCGKWRPFCPRLNMLNSNLHIHNPVIYRWKRLSFPLNDQCFMCMWYICLQMLTTYRSEYILHRRIYDNPTQKIAIEYHIRNLYNRVKYVLTCGHQFAGFCTHIYTVCFCHVQMYICTHKLASWIWRY